MTPRQPTLKGQGANVGPMGYIQKNPNVNLWRFSSFCGATQRGENNNVQLNSTYST